MSQDWRERYADLWARTVLRVLATEYPYGAAHVSSGPDDVDVTPTRLHPAFHGCLDWHSSVHMQWSALRLLRLASAELGDESRAGLAAVLGERLSAQHCAVEAAYLGAHPGYERPYGWGWAALLAAEAALSPVAGAEAWAAATRQVYDAVAGLVVAWMPRLAYPVRHGEHANTAFGLALVHEAARSLGDSATADAVEQSALRWFGEDRGYQVRWEPGGSDFLSPALCEADLMRRVLPPDRFAGWLAELLPDLAAEDDPLLTVPEVLDRTDGKAVHLFGLALSRAWQLRLLAPALPVVRRERVAVATAHQVSAMEREIVEGDFMSTHWLVSFALLAVTADGADSD
ncbi:MAG: hypothetical protein QOF53_1549 [Nocardioidaceae bacterium]|nr:hypothetical protein [Nocardioidaceae bacterium]